MSGIEPDRWEMIVALAEAASSREGQQRTSFLDEACAGDRSLRSEIESLLASDQDARDFLEEPVSEIVGRLIASSDEEESMIGRRFGPYTILDLLGVGGMGKVYLAYDERLERKIALKLLPRELTLREDRVRRFQREARAASALNHPNILTIHDIGEVGSAYFIATEFIEGQTLRERISSGEMTRSEVLDIVTQIASALAVAHKIGIVHRDIKPENIMLRPDGYVKVLDFGLAKLSDLQIDQIDLDATIGRLEDTEPRLLLGTPKYMSPEQILRLRVDGRADIFSLGVVLYEMIAGRPPFDGATITDIASAIMETRPAPLAEHSSEVTTELERLVDKMLSKERENRHKSADELLIELKLVKQDLGYEGETGRPTPHGPSVALADHRKSGSPDDKAVAPARGASGRSPLWSSQAVNQVRRHKVLFAGLFVAIVAVPAILSSQHSTAGARIDSVAILPFENETHDEAIEYLGDSLVDALASDLSSIPELRVLSRNSVARYKGKEVDPISVGSDLNVGAVITGRVRKFDNQLGIVVELTDTRDGSLLWSQQYNPATSDLLSIQQAVGRNIVGKLRAGLAAEGKAVPAWHKPTDPAAYDLYAKGRWYWNRKTGDGLRQAIVLFQQAIDIDPGFALAYAGLADAYVLNGAMTPREAYQRGKAAAVKAMELDENLGEAHATLAFIQSIYERDWASAEQEFNRAIELNPDYANARHWYALHLAARGQFDRSLQQVLRAQELDPLSPIINTDVGLVYFYMGQYDLAFEQLQKAGNLFPDFFPPHFHLGWVLTQKGEYAEAEVEYQKALSLSPNYSLTKAMRAYTFAVSGKDREARDLLNELLQSPQYVSPYRFAVIYAGLGEKDLAFEWLNRAADELDTWIIYVNVAPFFGTLRQDPRFLELLQHLKLAP